MGRTAKLNSLFGSDRNPAGATAPVEPDRIVWSSCSVNCGSRCPLRVHVKDGVVVRIETDAGPEDVPGAHQIRACLRGRAMREWLYSPDRLKYPLKRVGRRGEGLFERISWDEALDIVADSLKRIIGQYGNEAVTMLYGTGNLGGTVSRREQIERLMNLAGGMLRYYNSYSTAQITHAMEYTYGGRCGNHITDLVHSRLAVLFGNNPAETRMSGGGTVRDIIEARRQGRVKTIVIDPRYTDTAAVLADEWIPIRPGTDAALASALAHVMIEEDLIDRKFLAGHCVGFDQSTMPADVPPGNSYSDYILGAGPDNIPKTPGWAGPICGVPAERIVKLAREMGQAKPAFISQGWGPQRQANGEQTARAIAMLAVLTGNVGIRGGNTGDREGNYGIDFPRIPVGRNPVKTAIPCFLWTRAIEDYQSMTALNSGVHGRDRLVAPLKFIWNFAGNVIMNQHSDLNRTKQILADEKKCEMIVVMDNVMTASAAWADIVLPMAASLEEADVVQQGYAVEMGAVIVREQAVEPHYQSRTLFDVCAGVAERLGIKDEFTEGRDHDQWVEHMYHRFREVEPRLPEDYGRAVEQGLFKWPRPGEPGIALQEFRTDPVGHPLATPSGKIEIFSKRLWEMSRIWELPEGDVITATPQFVPTWGMPGDPAAEKYPLQLIGHHYKQRTHSSYGNNPWLEEAARQQVWINPLDAEARGIGHNDRVVVFNDLGRTVTRAKVTARIAPGTAALPQGAWHRPVGNGTDKNGCINVLTSHRPSPLAKGNPQHTNLVQIEKLIGGDDDN